MDKITGEIVKKLRLERGLTQSALALETGLSRRMICAIELGESNVTAQQLKVLSHFFGVSADYLLFGECDVVTQTEREILSVVRTDKSLYNSLLKMVNAKKTINSLCA